MYAHGGRTDEGTPVDNAKEGVHVILTPRDVNADTDRISMEMRFASGSEFISDDGLTVTQDFRMLLPGAVLREGQGFAFTAGAAVPPTVLELRTSGAIERWPFDTHPVQTMLLVSTADESGQDVPVHADLSLGEHHVPGWNITIRVDHTSEPVTLEGGEVVKQYVIEARRATATVAFGLVLLALMVMMPALGLTVAILVLRGRRKVEIGIFTWNAGMLFATPTLRNFLPGQPPIGSWVDYLVVLWVVAGLILALLISVVAWYRWTRPQPEIDRRKREEAQERARSTVAAG
nr:DUF4436 family protein [Microbacterium pseudoresistens]